MTVSSAVGMRTAFDAVAFEMVHLAQVMSQRLEIFAKKRKIGGQGEIVLKARWLGKRAIFIDALPHADGAAFCSADGAAAAPEAAGASGALASLGAALAGDAVAARCDGCDAG